jgi:hypothetical protein
LKLTLAVLSANFLTGLLLGRFASKADRNGVVPLLLLWLVYCFFWVVLAGVVLSVSWPWIVAVAALLPFVALLPLALGGALTRPRPHPGD